MLLQDSTRQKHCPLDRTNWSFFGRSHSAQWMFDLRTSNLPFLHSASIFWLCDRVSCLSAPETTDTVLAKTQQNEKQKTNSCLDYLRRFLSSVEHKGRCCTQNVIAANLILVLLGGFGTTQCIAKCLHSFGQPKTFKQICLVDYVSTCNMN